MNEVDFFHTKIKIDSTTGCWDWIGPINSVSGYGLFQYHGKQISAHRWMYQHVHGVQLDRKQLVCHSCDVTYCVNPKHLWLGTHKDNMKDMVRKGRSCKGKNMQQAQFRLTDRDREDIIYNNTMTKKALAEKYNVGVPHIYAVIRRHKNTLL